MKTLEETEAMIRNDPHIMAQMVAIAINNTPGAMGCLESIAAATTDAEQLEHAKHIADAINGVVRQQAQFTFDLRQALDLVQAQRQGPAH